MCTTFWLISLRNECLQGQVEAEEDRKRLRKERRREKQVKKSHMIVGIRKGSVLGKVGQNGKLPYCHREQATRSKRWLLSSTYSVPGTLLSTWHISSSVQLFSRVQLLATPWTAACQVSLSITKSRSPPKPMSIESVMPSNHLILCRPLLLLPVPWSGLYFSRSIGPFLCSRC